MNPISTFLCSHFVDKGMAKRIRPVILSLACGVCVLNLSMPVSADENSKEKESQTNSDEESALHDQSQLESQAFRAAEVSGVIVDRTITRLGKDFYSFFSRKIYEQLTNLDQNVLVEERPTALSGSIITVFHQSTPIYRTALSPGRKQAEDKSEEAFQVLQNYMLQWELEKKFRDKTDLADSELE
ncbi:MAG: CsgE family curli-type amyloid fiber assembly protein [Vibrio sp.]